MHETIRTLGLHGIIPVVAIDNAAHALPLARALGEGGLHCIEITFRTAAAAEALAAIAHKVPTMLAGAGTVLTIEQAKLAKASGARFIVSPGLNRKVVEYCLAEGIPVTPGVATPSDVEAALDLGLEVVKFFPAEAAGGVKFLNALSAPYRSVRFIPTGGIDETNILSYLKLPRVVACGGSWMVKPELINAGKFDEIRALTSKAVATMLGFELRHVGVNCVDQKEASGAAALAASLFSLSIRQGAASEFVGNGMEFLYSPGRGTHGHLAITTNFIDRAIAHFERRGIRTIPESRVEKDGKLHVVYLDVDLAGFAVHLIQP
jgi:2-dehydro-3-deoxyphosphogluconate aldolase/(4S)-4-hydroxy-2-oxoglutarate aldolase